MKEKRFLKQWMSKMTEEADLFAYLIRETSGKYKFLFSFLLKNFLTWGLWLFWLCCLFYKLYLVWQSNLTAALPNHQIFRNTLQWKVFFPIKFEIRIFSPSLKAHPFWNEYISLSQDNISTQNENENYISGKSIIIILLRVNQST